ncbi:MAG: hypothetical protein WKF81_09715 [Thermomicrobiales bacterium]
MWSIGLLVVELGGLFWLIRRHSVLRRQRDAIGRMIEVNRRGLARFALRWSELPDAFEHDVTREHPFAWDLNIVGDASLLRRIGTPVSDGGWNHLLTALTATTRVVDIRDRQVAVQELASAIDARQRVESVAVDRSGHLSAPSSLLEWSEGEDENVTPGWLTWFARISPVVTATLMILQWTGVLAFPFWLLPLVIQVGVSQTIGTGASLQIRRIAPLYRELTGYVEMFETISSTPADAPVLQTLRARLADGDASASTSQLSRVCSLVIPSGTLLYVPMQMVFLWDVNVLSVMEHWKARSGRKIRGWIDATAEWESLAALSVLDHDHPEWAFPVLDNDLSSLNAENLRHPLIADPEAIGNDVTVGPQATILFVTGSNMSGKSTLLRAVGVNAVLARVGAPVAADRMTLPSLDIRSCMRVEDSIERGVSFFMAELLRLKSVVDAAKETDDQTVLYLLDEILQGTNTAERQIASRQVMTSLAGARAIGAVSSHDLELFEQPDLAKMAVPVHFAEQFDRTVRPPDMHFDYQLRSGIATSTNALALMELLGFDVSP